MSKQPIHLRRDGSIATMVLNRPAKHNALNLEIWQTIPTLIAKVQSDGRIKALLVRGHGSAAFAAGADIEEFEHVHATVERARDYFTTVAKAYSALANLNKPTIAVIRGICYGGGCALALNCDVRYADNTARFCIPPAKLGLAYSFDEAKKLCDLVGPSRAKEMLMSARVMTAEEALQAGLITQVFATADLDAAVTNMATSMATLSQYTIRAAKQVVDEITNGAVMPSKQTQRLIDDALTHPDYREGRKAFIEKRPPKFS